MLDITVTHNADNTLTLTGDNGRKATLHESSTPGILARLDEIKTIPYPEPEHITHLPAENQAALTEMWRDDARKSFLRQFFIP